jgi:hypothetical protein
MSKQPPVDEVRLGQIRAAIWDNGSDGEPWYNVTIKRDYKDGDGWKSTDGFGRDDLLTAAKVLNIAHTRIYQLQARARDSKQPSGESVTGG